MHLGREVCKVQLVQRLGRRDPILGSKLQQKWAMGNINMPQLSANIRNLTYQPNILYSIYIQGVKAATQMGYGVASA